MHSPRQRNNQQQQPMNALAAAAAEVEGGLAGGKAGAVGTGGSAGPGGGGDAFAEAFPVFVGCRRRLPPDDELFESGNIEREQLAHQAAVAVARDERLGAAKEAELAHSASLASELSTRFECGQCHATLPTACLLELHVAELHDSFFAAQAARRMPVYLCLVEGCHRKFCTVEERKQHLADHHKFPRNFHFDRIHLRRHRGQIRPLPQFRKAAHGRQAMAAEASEQPGSEGGGTAGPAAGAGAGPAAGPAGEAAAGGAAQQGPGASSAAEEVAHGMSRLSMAAEQSSVPSMIHFGRGRGRGLPGMARGRGGHKVPAGGAAGAAPMAGD